MATQILEFSSTILKDGINLSDPNLLSICRTCIDEFTKAGGTHFRLLTSSPKTEISANPILVVLGIWPSVEIHTKVVESGLLMQVLGSLKPLISPPSAAFFRIPKPTVAQEEVLRGDLVTAFFHVFNDQDFEGEVHNGLAGKEDFVAGWKTTAVEGFLKSDENVWGVLLQQKNRSVVDDIKKVAGETGECGEILAWDSLDC